MPTLMPTSQRPTAETLTALLIALETGQSIAFYPYAGAQPVGYAYKADFAYYVAGASFYYGGLPLGAVCLNYGKDAYNVGRLPADCIYCLPSIEAAALKLSYLVLPATVLAA